MKKLLLFFSCIFVAVAVTLNAQDFARKGLWELGGSVSYTNNSFVIDGESGEINGFEIPTANTFLVNVPVYYFVIDGWQVGLVPEFASMSLGNNDFDVTVSAYGIFFSTAFNFNTKGSVYPFIEGKIGYNSANITIDADTSGLGSLLGDLGKVSGVQQSAQLIDQSASGLGWGFSGGIKVQVAKGALITLSVGYQQRTMDPDENEDIGIPADLGRNGVNSIIVGVGFSVFLGR